MCVCVCGGGGGTNRSINTVIMKKLYSAQHRFRLGFDFFFFFLSFFLSNLS